MSNILLTLSAPSNTTALLKATACNHAEVRRLMHSAQSSAKWRDCIVTVHDVATGQVWSGKLHHSFPGF